MIILHLFDLFGMKERPIKQKLEIKLIINYFLGF